MFSFRSSPYGSTSHALANQNAFNTFWSGQPLFYSSGHHISFIDKHSMYCLAPPAPHNTLLVNGIGQRIGTEGYGWIPRYYVGEKIGYVLGDASNAYGKVISKSWLARAKKEEVSFSPEAGLGRREAENLPPSHRRTGKNRDSHSSMTNWKPKNLSLGAICYIRSPIR